MPEFKNDAPYVVAIVELQGGVRISTNIVGCAPEEVRVGMKVSAVFDHVTEEATLLKFTPVAEEITPPEPAASS